MELTPYDPDADANVTPRYVARTSSNVGLSHSHGAGVGIGFNSQQQMVNFRRVQSLREQPTSPPVSLSMQPPHSALPQVSLPSMRRPVIDVMEYGSMPMDIFCPTSVLLMVSGTNLCVMNCGSVLYQLEDYNRTFFAYQSSLRDPFGDIHVKELIG